MKVQLICNEFEQNLKLKTHREFCFVVFVFTKKFHMIFYVMCSRHPDLYCYLFVI